MPSVILNGLSTYYEVAGDGPPLLLISGSSLDHSNFDPQVPAFGKQFTCITYDLRGVGQTAVPRTDYSIVDLAKDAVALLDHLGFASAHVAGYSLGGCVGQELAIQFQQRVRTLSLYSSLDRCDPYTRWRNTLRIKLLEDATPEVFAAFTVMVAFGEEYINSHASEVEAEYQRRVQRWTNASADEKRGVLGHYKAILTHDATGRLSAIRCPTWISVGTSDTVTPPSYSERLHHEIPGSELKVFAGAPHRILTFHADAFNAAALAFLLRHRDTAAPPVEAIKA